MDGNSNIVSANTKNVHKFALQQKARGMLFLVVIVVPVFIAGIAYLVYQDTVSQQEVGTAASVAVQDPESIDQAINPDSTQAPNTEITPPAPPSVDTPQSPGSSNQGGTATTQSSKIPSGLETALKSIETNGIKGSAYVSSKFNTNSIPDGTTISFDRSSWSKISDTSGSIKGTVYIYGQPQKGSVTFTESGGVWRATGYALN
jgi:hypothetical protein